MKPDGKRHKTIPVALGGQYSAGDPSMIPDGAVRSLRNYMVRAGRFDGRAPFVYDSLDGVNGFGIWEDSVNEVTYTVAAKTSDQKIYKKNTNGTGYAAGIATLPTGNLTSSTNLLGTWYGVFSTSGVPSGAASFDGTNVSSSPFNSVITARAIVSYINRLFLIGPRVTVTGQVLDAYDWTNGLFWVPTNITPLLITDNTNVLTGRLMPTSSTASACSIVFDEITAGVHIGNYALSASTTEQKATWRGDFRGVHASVDCPITMEWLLICTRRNSTAYVAGEVIAIAATDGNTYRYRCTTGGTTTNPAPSFTPTLGGTTADGTVTWTNEGSNVMASFETFISNITANPNWRAIYLTATVPPLVNTGTHQAFLATRLKMYNSTQTALTTLTPIDISFKDNLSDGDPAKRNYGQQVTAGDFFYPFVNVNAGASNTFNLDQIIWSEIANPKQIIAKNTFPLTEVSGLPTAGIACNGRLVAFKRKAMYIFKGTGDPNEPILPETQAIRVGCLGPRALDVSRNDELFWISENHVYRMKPGEDAFPKAIDSPGMFEEIFSRGANWVESQSTYKDPLLAIDHANSDVWVYAQKGKIYVYSIQADTWSYIDTNPTGTAAEVAAMTFDPVSNRMLVSFGGAAACRFDETSDAGDTIVSGGGTTWNIVNEVVFKPFELFAPRYEASVLELGLFHLATIQNGSLSLSYSYDRGTTYTTPSGYPVTTWLSNPRIRMPLAATGPSVQLKVSRTGLGGARNWSISKADALLRVHRGEIPFTNAT